MITAEQAILIAKNYLMERGRDYDVETFEEEKNPRHKEKFKLRYGSREGEIDDVWVKGYFVDLHTDPVRLFIYISATTGKVYYTTGPTTVVEEYEDAGFQ